MEESKIYKSTVCADISCIRTEVDNVIGFFHKACGCLEECTLFELKVILNELLLNAIKHGNKHNSAETVKIKAGLDAENCAFIEIEDAGEGYDYECFLKKAENTCFEKDIVKMKETGRGLLIVKSLCDSMGFNKKGNKVIVEKKLERLKSK